MATPPLPWAASWRENSVERSLLRSNIKFPSAFLPVIPCPAEIWTSRIQIPRHECSASLWMLTRHYTKGLPKGSCSTCSAPPQSWSLDLDCCKAFWLWGLFAASSCTSLPTGLNWESPNSGWPRLCARQSFRWEAGHDDRLLSATSGHSCSHYWNKVFIFCFFISTYKQIMNVS